MGPSTELTPRLVLGSHRPPTARCHGRRRRLGAAAASPEPSAEPARKPDVIYVPTPQPVVDRMLQMAQVKQSDVVYDLGLATGRIVVTAAKRYGAQASAST